MEFQSFFPNFLMYIGPLGEAHYFDWYIKVFYNVATMDFRKGANGLLFISIYDGGELGWEYAEAHRGT